MIKTRELSLVQYFELNHRPDLKLSFLLVYHTLLVSLLRHHLLLKASLNPFAFFPSITQAMLSAAPWWQLLHYIAIVWLKG